MIEMMLRLDPVGRRLIIGAPGVARVVRLRPATGTTFETTAPFMMPVPGDRGFAAATVTVDSLTLDAGSNWLSAQGTGIARVRLRRRGRSATTPPCRWPARATPRVHRWARTSRRQIRWPLWHCPSRSPWPAAAARLVLGDERVDLPPSRDADQIVGFTKPMALALRYGSTYQVEVDAWSDLAQNPGRPLPKLTTQAAARAEPGGRLRVRRRHAGWCPGRAEPRLPGPGGQEVGAGDPCYFRRSLSPRFTVRLARAANDVVVRVTLRPLGACTSPTVSTYGVNLRIAVPGGSIVHATLPRDRGRPHHARRAPPGRPCSSAPPAPSRSHCRR